MRREDLAELIALGRELKAAIEAERVVEHPLEPELRDVYGVIFWQEEAAPAGVALCQRNVTVFADGEVDRSPCGSGTSARLALLDADGTLARGELLHHLSMHGSGVHGARGRRRPRGGPRRRDHGGRGQRVPDRLRAVRARSARSARHRVPASVGAWLPKGAWLRQCQLLETSRPLVLAEPGTSLRSEPGTNMRDTSSRMSLTHWARVFDLATAAAIVVGSLVALGALSPDEDDKAVLLVPGSLALVWIGIGFVRSARARTLVRVALALVLLAFAVVSLMSIGVFYLPAVLAGLVAAVLGIAAQIGLSERGDAASARIEQLR